jgi:regulator of sirC expression with transglutaminase-like and TPR domain
MLWTAPTPLDYFASLVADDDHFALTEAAVALAQDDNPELDTLSVLATLDAHAQAVRLRFEKPAGDLHKLRQLHHYLYVDLGLAGNVNDFYSPANSHLHEVLRTRRGIPISLAVIYLELAGQLGIDAHGLSFPGHFLIKLRLPLGDAVIDPLNGSSLSRQELEDRLEPYLRRGRDWGIEGAGVPADWLAPFLVPSGPREIISRMLRNLEAVHRSNDDLPRMLQVQQRLVVLQPEEWDWRRDRGLTLAKLGQTEAAIADLALYLSHARSLDDRARVSAQLEALREAGPPRWH